MKNKIFIIPFLFVFLHLIGCSSKTSSKTTLEVVDNQRHYYPLVQGRELEIVFDIKNTGEHAFELQDILVSCGCIIPNLATIKTIPAHGIGKLILTYDSTKNIGYVEHYITLYGNTIDQKQVDIVFDLNVVPDAHYTNDYEELFEQYKSSYIKDAVEGKNNRDYYVDK